MSLRIVACVAWMSLAIPTSGCVPRHQAGGETRTAQGKLYQSDNPAYDEYFEGVHALQKQTSDATDDEAKARVPLEQALGTRGASPERLVDLTRDRVRKGREGSPLHFLVTGLEPLKEGEKSEGVTVTVRVPDEAAIPSSQRDVVKALDASGQSEAQVAEKFGPISMRARRLLARHDQLVTTIDKDFTTKSRQDEVSRELAASKTILHAASDRADKASTAARSFLKGMAAAFSASTEPNAGAPEKSGGKGRPKPVRGAAAPPVTKAPASPAPSPKPPRPESPPPAPPAEAPPKPVPPVTPPAEDFNP